VIAQVVPAYDERMISVQPSLGLSAIWEIVDAANKYLVERAPWALAKEGTRPDELAEILYQAAETLRILAILIQPIMPSAAQRLWDQLGVGGSVSDRRLPIDANWGGLEPGTITHKGESLFPRLDPAT
jgi:methionyl-tRNA synthetase